MAKPILRHMFERFDEARSDGTSGPSQYLSHAKLLEYLVKATFLDTERIASYADGSATPMAALPPVIGCHTTAHITQAAAVHHTTLRKPAPASGKVTAEKFDSIVKAINMIGDPLGEGNPAQFPMPCPTRCAGSRR
jgi:hypothetical protein